MGRKRRTKEEMMGQNEDRQKDTKIIGPITTPMKNIPDTKRVLESHGVLVIKCNSDDGWYTLLLPEGSMSKVILDAKRETYDIVLPDGYRFYYMPPVFTRHDKEYLQLPEISIEHRTITTTACDYEIYI